jgi:hypothetical protein
MKKATVGLGLVISLWTHPRLAYSFEHTRVLPKGVRNINIRNVQTDLAFKTDAGGRATPLASPLHQELTFKKIAKDETPIRAEQLKGFLLSHEFSLDEGIGAFTADLKGRLAVTAPIISFGLTDSTTLALAVPYYQAQTDINVGFLPNERAKAFLAALSKTENNQIASAREAAMKLNNAVERLNNKLVDHDFKKLDTWKASGVGDVTIAAKTRAISEDIFAVSTTFGVVAPTGRVDDPDVLTDMAFGDGQWDTFGQIAVDELLPAHFSWNQFAKYTVQLSGKKNVRQVTSDEKIEVEKKQLPFKLGDRIEAGSSLVWEPRFGLTTGVGLGYMHKFSDRYEIVDEYVKAELEKNTEISAQTTEWSIGYSTVPLYQSGLVPVPFEVKLTETRQLQSRNNPITDLIQVDMSLFF